MLTFIKAIINDTVIYVKVDNGILSSLLDTFFDNKYVIEKATPEDFDNNIEFGTSYEIDSEEELETFIDINHKANTIRNNETQS